MKTCSVINREEVSMKDNEKRQGSKREFRRLREEKDSGSIKVQ